MVSFEDFAKLQFKVAVVECAEPMPGSSKLLRLSVDVGGEKRTLVAGIAGDYKPEELRGKKVIVLTNLEPKTIRGVVSNGMVLAADAQGKIALLTVDRDVPSGALVR